MARKKKIIVREIKNERFKEVKEEKDLEEDVELNGEEEKSEEDFVEFFSNGERIAPVLQTTPIKTPELERATENAPSTPAAAEHEEKSYVINAPNYSASYETMRQEREETRKDVQMDVTHRRLMRREQDITRAHQRNTNLGMMQEREIAQARHGREVEEDYVSKLKRKRDETKLPFEE